MQKCVALIVAAGRGSRFGDATPKQYQLLNDRMILRHSVAVFLAHPLISAVKVVIHPDDEELYDIATKDLDLLPPCFGGKERQDSVRLGLESLSKEKPDIVLIHDGARPFVTFDIISDVIAKVQKGQGAIAAIPVTDTIKRVATKDSDEILTSVDRSLLWRAQTPQAFMYNEILGAHQKAIGLNLTDDATVAEDAGIKVLLVKSLESNKKITTAKDLTEANANKKEQTVRVAQGLDVHAFTEGNELCLCGVKIPFKKKLLGHSDADVALHALTDAIYGVIGSGDIGMHFPPSEAKWKNADSELFAKHAISLLKALGGKINNVDITIICEEPKIGPYRIEMITNIARILGVSQALVSVKGTTTEALGFTGRKEGICAMAVVSASF